MENNYTNILEDCIKIANERQASYGEASENLQKTCDILHVAFGIEMNPSQLALVLVALKLSREQTQHKPDNILDMVNYLCIYLHTYEKHKQ